MFSRRLITLVFIFFVYLTAYTQIHITGKITNSKGDWLLNHPVYFFSQDSLLRETKTDELGVYSFEVGQASEVYIVKTVGFCDSWQTYQDSIFPGLSSRADVDFEICHKISDEACDSDFEIIRQSEYLFQFLPDIEVNEFINYHWEFGDGTTSANPISTHDFGERGVYSVQLITENPVGCEDTVKKEVLAGNESYVRGTIETNDNFLSNAFVWLIGFDFDQNSIINTIYPDFHGNFSFWCEPYTRYLVKIVPDFGINNYAPRLLPTYWGNAYYWQDAEVLDIGHEIKDLQLITLESNFIPHGFNEIHGQIHETKDVTYLPITVYLMDENEQPIDFARVENHQFKFVDLPAGTYYVLPESAGKVSHPLKIVFEGDFEPSAEPEFKISTTQISPLVGISSFYTNEEILQISPIPAGNTIDVTSVYPVNQVHIYSAHGQLINTHKINALKQFKLPASNLNKGTYLLKAIFESQDVTSRVFIK